MTIHSNQSIAVQIRCIRQQLGLTQSEFASLLNVSYRAVQSWEGNLRVPAGVTMLRIMELYARTSSGAASNNK